MIAYEKKLQGQNTPTLKSKRSGRNKQPTILQVNLNEQYKKHYKNFSENAVTFNPNLATNNPNAINNNSMINYKNKKPTASSPFQKQAQPLARTPKQDKSSINSNNNNNNNKK